MGHSEIRIVQENSIYYILKNPYLQVITAQQVLVQKHQCYRYNPVRIEIYIKQNHQDISNYTFFSEKRKITKDKKKRQS